ncbi:hypothetical protein [Daejeonella sp.]|uniref:hypothetical protein n=1 Tax=Daejeonella sp. TaxID=2805397 RepID=UPI00272610AD|nr:hypothetical protein [Daejeonella sp.]MDO8991867.1 hypothetical protein [Daejeonella sp.]MDP2412449.1 hypothetical protein [Daejeonella sp.]
MKLLCITTCLLLFNTLLFGQGEKEFFKAIRSLEGKTFYGKAIYMPDTTKANDFWGKVLSFKVSRSNRSELKLPFNVGENQTRTWVLTKTKGGIRLKHDHRHTDGSPDSITNYGRDSDQKISTALAQYLPADEFTSNLIPAAKTNRWIMEFSPDKKNFITYLNETMSSGSKQNLI